MYKFSFSIKHKDLFNSSLNYSLNYKALVFDAIFTLAAIFATIYTIFTGIYFTLTILYRILLILCCILFPIIQPIIIYIKSYFHYLKIKDIQINMIFDDEKISISSKDESTIVLYENVYNFIKFKNMIVVLYDSIHGQIMPDRIFNNNKDEFYDYVSSKIKYAREKAKEKNN